MVFNVEWGDGEEYETFNPDKAKQKAKDKGGKVFLSDDVKGRLKNDEQVYPDPNEFELPGIRKKKTKQGRMTSLKARLARLRLGSDFEDKHPELADPVTRERRKKSKAKKAAQEPYNEYTKNTGDKRKKKNKLTRSDQKRGKTVKRSRAQDNKENRKNKSGKPPTIGGYDPDLDY
tara:strand:- start:41 stop:565 length:525 start_codon:yes stop_codon:yes gene_type:complete